MSLKEDHEQLQKRHTELVVKHKELSEDNKRLLEEIATLKAGDPDTQEAVAEDSHYKKRLAPDTLGTGSFEFRLADHISDEIFRVMVGGGDMSVARAKLRDWWRGELIKGSFSEEGPYHVPFQKKEDLNLVEFSRKTADRLKGIAEAMSQEVRALSLTAHSG